MNDIELPFNEQPIRKGEGTKITKSTISKLVILDESNFDLKDRDEIATLLQLNPFFPENKVVFSIQRIEKNTYNSELKQLRQQQRGRD
jgi:hypothetical protein